MEFIGKFDRFLLLGDTKNIALIRMEAHEPILFPSCCCFEILLEVSCIILRVDFFIENTVICK